MDALCPLVESSTDTAHDRLTLGAILGSFLPALLHLLKLWYTGIGRQSFRLSPLSTSTLGAALLR
jgi:hypothetical protein